MKESDLYPPLKKFLESRSYEVKGEVNNCDVVAVRADEDPVVVELKLSLNLGLILQAVERLALTPDVYIAVPKKSRGMKGRRKRVIKLMRMLGLGLIIVDPGRKRRAVEVLLEPSTYQPRTSKQRRARLLTEFRGRSGDPNLGGTNSRGGIMTAYRQDSLEIAQFIAEHGPTKAATIAASLDIPKARIMLYRNVYGWFERKTRGVYDLAPASRAALALMTQAHSNGAPP